VVLSASAPPFELTSAHPPTHPPTHPTKPRAACPPHTTNNPRAGEDSRGALLWGASGAVDRPVVFRENGVRFESDVVMGQKTGFFLDQRDNRQRMQVGGWIGGGGGGGLVVVVEG